MFLLRAVVAFALPLTGDEAYYWEWSRRLAFGYVDHPPAAAWTIGEEHLRSKSRNTPFLGHEVTGRASHTIVNGEVRYEASIQPAARLVRA